VRALRHVNGLFSVRRETVTDTIVAVVGAEPDWKSLPADTPVSIRRLLTRCLQKDARRRLHDIADARIEIEDAMTTPVEAAAGPTPRRRSRLALLGADARDATALVLLWVARDRFGRPAAKASPDTRVIRLTDLPALRSLRPFPRTASRWRSPPALAATTDFRAAYCGRRAPADHTRCGGSPVPSLVARLSSILYFSPAVSGAVQGSIWEIPTFGGVHGVSSTAWGELTSAQRMGGWRFSGWRKRASSWYRVRRRFQIRPDRPVHAHHILLVSPLVAGRPMDCLSAGRHD